MNETFEAVVSAVQEPATYRPLPPNDKLLAFQRGPNFTWFARLSPRFGELLCLRYAETRLAPLLQSLLVTFPDTVNILALVTEEDPETPAVLPVVARLVDACPRMRMQILRDEDNLAPLATLMPDLDAAAWLEEWDLPQFLLFDEDWELQAQWGPRPAAAEIRLDAWLAEQPEYEALADDESPAAQERYAILGHELVYEMRLWYNSGLAQACLDEWYDLLLGLQGGDENGTSVK